MWTHALITLLLSSGAAAPIPAPPDSPAALGLQWFEGSYEEALNSVQGSDQMLFLYFWAESSEQCGKFQEQVFAEPSCVEALSDYVCVGANVVRPDGAELVKRFGVKTLPTILIVDPSGTVEDGVIGFIDPGGFMDEIERIERGENTVSDFRRRVKEDPRDLEVLYGLAIKLYDVGDEAGHDELVAHIKKRDPRGKNLVAARLHLQEAQKAALENALDEKGELAHPDTVRLKPVVDWLRRLDHEELLFDGWRWVADVQKMSHKPDESRDAAMRAWDHRPADRAIAIRDYANDLAWQFWEQREQLSPDERKFALHASEAAMEAFQKVLDGECGCDTGCSCLVGDDGRPVTEQEWFTAWKAGYLDTLAVCYHMNGERDRAVETAEAVVALLPENQEYRERLAMIQAGP